MNSWKSLGEVIAIVSLAVTSAFAQAPTAAQAPSAAQAQSAWSFPDFTAKQVFQAGDQEVSYKVYRAGSRVRVEPDPDLAILYDPVNDRVYRLTTSADGHQSCTAMAMAQTQMLPSPLALLFGAKVKRTPAGTATVDGQACDVEDVEMTMTDGKTIKSRVWEAKELKGVPLKIESELSAYKLTTFYRDVAIGTPDAALVTPPADCVPNGKVGVAAVAPASKASK